MFALRNLDIIILAAAKKAQPDEQVSLIIKYERIIRAVSNEYLYIQIPSYRCTEDYIYKMSAEKKHNLLKAFKTAFPHTLPVLAGFLILGTAYGILMQTKGYGTLWALLMSAIAFCGSMQFVAISLLTVVFDPIQAFLLSLMVNARHLFYGISMLTSTGPLASLDFLFIYTLCDETLPSFQHRLLRVSERTYFYFFIIAA